ncbi:hypothetical protein [Pseudonocardia adelaidensis]|uniref:Uncharacterized protein n=1 Tax=Pseudonocardia adelaidensis TaxID=648754 RepID=A0ABP9P6I8_9PSEU
MTRTEFETVELEFTAATRSDERSLAAAVTVANLYYAQPLLDSLDVGVDVSPSSAGLVVTTVQMGYALGWCSWSRCGTSPVPAPCSCR